MGTSFPVGWAILLIIVGFFALALPFEAGIAIAIVVAALVIVAGIAHLAGTFGARTTGGFFWRLLVGWGGEIFRTGLIMSLPVIAALLIANIAIGILTRAAPQLNIFAVGFPLTLAVGFFALWLAIPFIGPQIASLFEQAVLAAMSIVEHLAPAR